MASPSGVTMPAIDIQEGSFAVVRKATKILGQLIRIQPNSQVQTRKLARLGDTNKYTSFQPAEHSVQMEIYSESDIEELAALLGGTQKPVSGGWLGTEQIRLNPTVAKFDLLIDMYNAATGTGDILRGTYYLVGFKATSMSPNLQAESNGQISINGELDDMYYKPAAGAGA